MIREAQHHADWSYFQCVTTSLKWTLVQPSNQSVCLVYLLSCSLVTMDEPSIFQLRPTPLLCIRSSVPSHMDFSPISSLSWCSPLFWIIPISIQMCYYVSIFKKSFPILLLSSNYWSQVSVTVYHKIHQRIVYTHCFHHLPLILKANRLIAHHSSRVALVKVKTDLGTAKFQRSVLDLSRSLWLPDAMRRWAQMACLQDCCCR